MRALIDGDIIVYWASNHCQTNYYNVVDKNGDNIKEYDSKRHAMDGLEDINALWSTQSKVGEISPYTIVQGKTVLEPWSECVEFIKDFIDSVVKKAKADDYELHLSGHTNFRKEIAVTKPYKGNRKYNDKPIIFPAIKEYLRQRWNFISVPELEADDLVSVFHDPLKTVICSPDKDVLKQVPGKHFNYQKMEWVNTSEQDANKFLWMQTLMGDSTDGIPGIPGMGPKTSEKIINETKYVDYYQQVLRIYIEKFGIKDGICKFTETFKLVYLLKTEEDILYNIRKPLEPIEFISINS